MPPVFGKEKQMGFGVIYLSSSLDAPSYDQLHPP
jgi:hypothetical protein